MEEEPDSMGDTVGDMGYRGICKFGSEPGWERSSRAAPELLHLGVDPGAGPSSTSPWTINIVLTYLSTLAY